MKPPLESSSDHVCLEGRIHRLFRGRGREMIRGPALGGHPPHLERGRERAEGKASQPFCSLESLALESTVRVVARPRGRDLGAAARHGRRPERRGQRRGRSGRGEDLELRRRRRTQPRRLRRRAAPRLPRRRRRLGRIELPEPFQRGPGAGSVFTFPSREYSTFFARPAAT